MKFRLTAFLPCSPRSIGLAAMFVMASALSAQAQSGDRGLTMASCASYFDAMTAAVSPGGIPSIWPDYADRWMTLAAKHSKLTAEQLVQVRQSSAGSWSFEFAQSVNGALSGLSSRGVFEDHQVTCSAMAQTLKDEGLWAL